MMGRLASVSSILMVSRIWTDPGAEGPPRKSPWDFPPLTGCCFCESPTSLLPTPNDPWEPNGLGDVLVMIFGSPFALTIPFFTPLTSSLNRVEMPSLPPSTLPFCC